MNFPIVIIGAGASGLMLASLLPKNSVLLLESNSKIGQKILVSGGGKCNITNTQMDASFYLGDADFIKPVLKTFNQDALLQWLERANLYPIIRKQKQYFCQNSAKELLDVFEKNSKKQKVLLNQKVISVEKREHIFYVKTEQKIYTCAAVVVASGGMSFPVLGASDIGYTIATSFGHTLAKVAPALVGFTVQKEQFFFKTLSGASTNVRITVGEKVCEGSLLFTHKGISGPAVLNASLYWSKGSMQIDFVPQFNWKAIYGSKKQISSLLPLAKRITKTFLVQFGLEDKPYYQYTPSEVEILKELSCYKFSPAGTFGYSKAEVSKGGISTSEIDNKTMMSKKEKGLYFLGEVLDVTGELGGYNFQWAFSSAFVCSKYLKKMEIL